MKTLLVVVMALGLGLGLATAGCGDSGASPRSSRTACQQALNKLDDCGIELSADRPTDETATECVPRDACSAKCINAGSCGDIEAAVIGTSNDVYSC